MPKIRKRMLYLIVALVVASPVLALAILSALATTPTNLGVVDGRLADCPDSPNCVSTQARDTQHEIQAITFDGSPDDAMKQLKAALATIPRLRIVSESENYLHAEATSAIFRFRDDVEFLIDPEAKVIHFRSASRVGKSDLGANRARMETIRTAFEQERR
jgi:uncharacterized protein (DUF1499 family)